MGYFLFGTDCFAMTYCVAMRLDAGLVFLSDSRTNAGVDQIGTFRKMNVFEIPGDRTIILMTAGNLAISQSVRQVVAEQTTADGKSIWTARSMYEAAQIVGEAIRKVHKRDAESLAKFNIEFNISMILGGQIKGERCRLFQLYAAGNFIESHNENTYFQIGEAKYGKPIIDRIVTPQTSLDEAAKCALISMDSTLRSNISVGLPLDLLIYETDKLAVSRFVKIDENNKYFQMIRNSWGGQLKALFNGIADPVWNDAPTTPSQVLNASGAQNELTRMPIPPSIPKATTAPQPPLQTLAQQDYNIAQP